MILFERKTISKLCFLASLSKSLILLCIWDWSGDKLFSKIVYAWFVYNLRAMLAGRSTMVRSTVSFLNGAWGYPLNFGGQKPFFWKTYQYWCDSIGNLLTRRDQVVFSKKNLFSGSEVSSKSKVRSKLPLKNNVFWRNKKIKKNWLQKSI